MLVVNIHLVAILVEDIEAKLTAVVVEIAHIKLMQAFLHGVLTNNLTW